MTDQVQPGYGFDQETPESTGTAVIPPGVHSNVKLVDVSYGTMSDESENYCLMFKFKDDQGRELTHSEWPIDMEVVRQQAVQDGKDPNKEFSRRIQAQGVRVKHIVTKVIPRDRAVVSKVPTFEAYAKAVVNLIKGALPSGPLHAKVLLNNKGYSTFPGYTPFLQKMEEGKETVLSISDREQTRMQKIKKKIKKKSDLDMPDADVSGAGVGGGDDEISDDDPPF